MVERFVVDANVVAKLYLKDETYSDKVHLLFSRFERGEVELAAPRLIIYEVPSTIKRGAVRERADEQTWHEAIKSFESLGLRIFDDSGAKYEAMRLAIKYQTSYYDAFYLLLAEDLDCPLITADEKLVRGLRGKVSNLISLASYA